MADAKIRVDFNLKQFEIEGTEKFVDKYWKEILSLFKNPSITTPILDGTEKTTNGGSDPMQKLAQVCNIPLGNLKNVFDYVDQNFVLIAKISGKSDVDKVVQGSLLILTAYNKGLGTEWLGSIKLGKALSTRSININHLADTLKANNTLFKDNGKKGRGMSYGLKTQGWQDGIELIKKLSQ